MNWPAVRQGFSDAVAKVKVWAIAHPQIVRYAGVFLAGLIVGVVLGKS